MLNYINCQPNLSLFQYSLALPSLLLTTISCNCFHSDNLFHLQRDPLAVKNGISGIPKPSRLLQPGMMSSVVNRKRPVLDAETTKEVQLPNCNDSTVVGWEWRSGKCLSGKPIFSWSTYWIEDSQYSTTEKIISHHTCGFSIYIWTQREGILFFTSTIFQRGGAFLDNFICEENM